MGGVYDIQVTLVEQSDARYAGHLHKGVLSFSHRTLLARSSEARSVHTKQKFLILYTQIRSVSI